MGAPRSLKIEDLQPWKDLDISPEGKAFSGTVNYSTIFSMNKIDPNCRYILDLGQVDMIADITINGKKLQPLWSTFTTPYEVDVIDVVKKGKNKIEIDVTGTWYNRLVYDAGQPVELRKTWTIFGPGGDHPLKETGLLGPVNIKVCNQK